MAFDNIDEEIVETLRTDASITYRDLSQQLSVSLGTLTKRIKRLRKQGVIVKDTILVDWDKLGYSLEVLVAINIAHGNFAKVTEKIIQDEHVSHIYNTTGNWDGMAVCRFKEKRELNSFLKRLQENPDVKETNTQLIIHTIR
ncbi:MAG: winged helix-turn-helix transcriptional regulator [Candidatus Altiarchaeales archaeon]|nr:winged helix-turn-helix transcriptional regulator [Candidatus Altiarchaeales archaeon]